MATSPSCHIPLQVEDPIPPPPAEAPPKATEEQGAVNDTSLPTFSELQQEEEAAALNESLTTNSYTIPSGAVLGRDIRHLLKAYSTIKDFAPLFIVEDNQVRRTIPFHFFTDSWNLPDYLYSFEFIQCHISPSSRECYCIFPCVFFPRAFARFP